MLVVFSGPSGAGKNAIISGLLERYPEVYDFMPTMTTRAKREGEREGYPYFFVSEREFLDMVSKGEFFEYERIHIGYYGTHKKILADSLARGKILLKDIDVKGTMSLKKGLESALDTASSGKANSSHKLLTIFVTAGSQENLRTRLISRGEKDIDLRLSRYESELQYADKYDHILDNIVLDEAIERAHEIIMGKV